MARLPTRYSEREENILRLFGRLDPQIQAHMEKMMAAQASPQIREADEADDHEGNNDELFDKEMQDFEKDFQHRFLARVKAQSDKNIPLVRTRDEVIEIWDRQTGKAEQVRAVTGGCFDSNPGSPGAVVIKYSCSPGNFHYSISVYFAGGLIWYRCHIAMFQILQEQATRTKISISADRESSRMAKRLVSASIMLLLHPFSKWPHVPMQHPSKSLHSIALPRLPLSTSTLSTLKQENVLSLVKNLLVWILAAPLAIIFGWCNTWREELTSNRRRQD